MEKTAPIEMLSSYVYRRIEAIIKFCKPLTSVSLERRSLNSFIKVVPATADHVDSQS